jgi:hypothetical protein
MSQGALESQDGFYMGVFPDSLLGKTREIFHRLLGVFGPGVVVCQADTSSAGVWQNWPGSRPGPGKNLPSSDRASAGPP